MIDRRTRLSSSLAALALAVILVALGCASSSSPEPVSAERGAAATPVADDATAPAGSASGPAAAPAAPSGRMVEGGGSLHAFRPEETAEAAPAAAAANLPAVLEQLGPDGTTWFQHVQTLSSPYFEGRAPGTSGIEHAAEYLEFEFRRLGLEPAFPDPDAADDSTRTSYRQPFDFPSPSPSVEVHRGDLRLGDHALTHGDDFIVFGNSAAATVTGPVTFVGYAIADGPDGYTSFDEDTDLTGRIALLLRYEPLDEDGKSRWSPRRFSPRAGIAPKMRAVAERGAAGILLVNPPGAVDGAVGLEDEALIGRFARRPLEIPVMQITPEAADLVLAAAGDAFGDLASWRTRADAGEVTTADLPDEVEVTMETDLSVAARLATENVGAVLPGRGDLADEWIVVGGHYDHVGYGYTGSMPGNAGRLHPGADDNASGTAGVLVTARRLATRAEGDEPRRSVMFLAFSAEEAGLHGSRYFVEHPSIPLDRTSLMVNFDMIGRLREDTITMQGTGTAAEFEEILPRHIEPSGLTVVASAGGSGPSDHSSFNAREIPVLFPFTGVHEDYHRPTDEAWTVNPVGALEVLDLVESIVVEVSERPEPLTFVKTGGTGQIRRTGARVRLGIMPSYQADLETGVLVEEVSEGTSAAAAGIEAGDVLMSWNGEAITGGRRLFELLSQAQPGERVQMGIQRGEDEIVLELILQARNEDG
jgi:hypothetical protein